MSNPNFVPLFSTNEIYRNTDNTICLTDDLDAIEAAIEELDELYAPLGHTHINDYITKDLQPTDDGDVEYSFDANCGKNLLDEIAAWPMGLHTAYSNGSVAGNPKNTESWRLLVHKTSDTIGWVLAFGTSGSIYSNYYNNTSWKGWRCIFDALGAPLWSGEKYMSANQEVVPSKPLSQCAHGWLLLWSDYNPGEGANGSDFATSMISKFSYSGQKWGGSSGNVGARWLCPVPRFADATGEAQIIKVIYVTDTKLIGNSVNEEIGRNDVVLRAVFEF